MYNWRESSCGLLRLTLILCLRAVNYNPLNSEMTDRIFSGFGHSEDEIKFCGLPARPSTGTNYEREILNFSKLLVTRKKSS